MHFIEMMGEVSVWDEMLKAKQFYNVVELK